MDSLFCDIFSEFESTRCLIPYTAVNRIAKPPSANPNNTTSLESTLSEFSESVTTEIASASGIIFSIDSVIIKLVDIPTASSIVKSE